MTACLRLFGPPSIVTDDGTTLPLPRERRHQLLVALALHDGWAARSTLATLLWPELPDKQAYTNLRKALFRLQELPWTAPIETDGNALRFTARTDVAAFDAALREGRRGEALVLRGGPLLPGFDDPANEAWTQWLNGQRERLASAWRAAALERLGDPAGEGGAAAAVELSARLLAEDPYDEAALRQHVEWLLRDHQAARAQSVWREFVARLRSELGVEPGSALRAWHDGLHGQRDAAPDAADRRPIAPPRAAAFSADGFVGRSAELHAIANLLQRNDVRLLTLLGPGGVGKTRLARRVLDEAAGSFSDGAAFVALEDVSATDQIAARLARDLGLELRGHSEPLLQVIAALAPRRQLIVLDNVEHLEGAAGVIERLLDGCVGLRVVATSRVRLALASEQLFALQGLPCPDAEDHDRLEAFDAARLFIRAAQRVEPALVPAAEAAAIGEICRLVEGLPLALELAAVWTRVMSCEAIADELRRGVELLSTADPTRSPRQASIAAVFEQSWSHLGAVERRVLVALSVFRGGFTLEAARRVAAAVPPVLAALVDRSLLHKGEGGRLYLHPLVQQFAHDRLQPSSDAAGATLAHARHYLGRLTLLLEPLRHADRDALGEVDLEFENIRAAWQHAAAIGARELLGASAVSLRTHCDRRGRFDEGHRLLLEAASATGVADDEPLRARLTAFAAHLAHRLDRHDEALAAAERLLASPAGRADGPTRQQCLSVLGAVHFQLGRLDEAKRYFREAYEAALDAGNTLGAAGMLDNLAMVDKRAGRYAEALVSSQQSLAILRRAGAQDDIALCLNGLGTLHLVRGDLAGAQACFEEGLEICERGGLPGNRVYLHANLAETALRRGDIGRADHHVQRATVLCEARRYRAVLAWVRLMAAQIAVRRREWGAARAMLAEGLRLGLETSPPIAAGGLIVLAELLQAEGETAAACRVLLVAIEQPALSAPDRDEMRQRLVAWGGEATAGIGAIGFDELVRRAIDEVDLAHAPLIVRLRGG